jgi:uncharacterized membrane protein YeiH
MAAVTGGIIFTLILNFFDALFVAQLIGIVVIVLIRVIVMRYKVGLPRMNVD